VAWLFTGAETACIPAEEVKEARRMLPRAALLGLGLVTALYLLVAFSLTLGMPASAIAGSRARWRWRASVRWVPPGASSSPWGRWRPPWESSMAACW
jgi:amino acid transporter